MFSKLIVLLVWSILRWNKIKQTQMETLSSSFNIYLVTTTVNQGKMWVYQHLKSLPRWGLKRWVFLVQLAGSQQGEAISKWEWNSSVCVVMRSMIRGVPCSPICNTWYCTCFALTWRNWFVEKHIAHFCLEKKNNKPDLNGIIWK